MIEIIFLAPVKHIIKIDGVKTVIRHKRNERCFYCYYGEDK